VEDAARFIAAAERRPDGKHPDGTHPGDKHPVEHDEKISPGNTCRVCRIKSMPTQQNVLRNLLFPRCFVAIFLLSIVDEI